METRMSRNKKKKVGITLKILPLFIFPIALISLFFIKNDMSVFLDVDAQEKLKLYDKHHNMVIKEKRVQQMLHRMTHQKVAARVKNGGIPMTKENIKVLITIVKNSDFKHKKEYLNILNEWNNNNFNNIVEQHNLLRELQKSNLNGDTIAYSKVSKSTEKEFIIKNYSKKGDH